MNLTFTVGVISAILIYLFPAFIACNRDHRNAASITVVNLFFGWTFVGWVVALAWSLSDNTAASSTRVG
jgi:hypothetical protein